MFLFLWKHISQKDIAFYEDVTRNAIWYFYTLLLYMKNYSFELSYKSIWLKLDIYWPYRIEDMITTDRVQCLLYWPINRYFYATERRLNDFVIFKNIAFIAFKVRYLIGQNHDVIYAKTEFIQSSLEHDQ